MAAACTDGGPGSDGGGGRNPAAPGSAAATSPGVPQVARPWQPGMPQLGVNVLWEDSKDDDDEVTRAKSRRLLDHLISLNVNSVAVNIPFMMKNKTASSVGPDPNRTPPPKRVRIFLEEAQASRMRITLRPILDERTLLPSWRGKIAPASRDKWFASYAKFLTGYAAVAQEHKVAELVVGVELNSMQQDRRWKDLIKSVRGSFAGELAYSVNFDEFQRGSKTPKVGSVGVDAYFKVDQPDNAPVKKLTDAWKTWLDRHAGSKAKTLVLHEVGIAAQNGAYHHPAQWGSKSVPLNLGVQKRWYQAVCVAAQEEQLAGLYFWNIRMHSDPGNEDPKQGDRLTFVDRPAETAMKDCYAEWGSAQP
jgi:hypothetical protein